MRTHKQNWLDVFAAFRIALDPRKIALGMVGILLSVLAFFGILSAAQFLWWPGAKAHIQAIVNTPGTGIPHFVETVIAKITPHYALVAPDQVVCQYPGFREITFTIGAGLLMLFIWSYFGGAIVRLAAVDFARDERMEIGEATGFASEKFGSFFWAPIVPFFFVGLFLLCIYALGLLGRIPAVGPIIVGLGFFLAVLAGFLAILLALGGLFGMMFMWPTIGMEGTDAFDAVSRGFNYLFVRPWKTLWCALAAAAYGIVVFAFVAAFASAMLFVATSLVRLGMGERFDTIGDFLATWRFAESGTAPMAVAGGLIRLVQLMVAGLALGFAASYKLSAFTIIYSIMRRDVDGTDMNEVYLPEETVEATPEKEASGVGTPTA